MRDKAALDSVISREDAVGCVLGSTKLTRHCLQTNLLPESSERPGTKALATWAKAEVLPLSEPLQSALLSKVGRLGRGERAAAVSAAGSLQTLSTRQHHYQPMSP